MQRNPSRKNREGSFLSKHAGNVLRLGKCMTRAVFAAHDHQRITARKGVLRDIAQAVRQIDQGKVLAACKEVMEG